MLKATHSSACIGAGDKHLFFSHIIEIIKDVLTICITKYEDIISDRKLTKISGQRVHKMEAFLFNRIV